MRYFEMVKRGNWFGINIKLNKINMLLVLTIQWRVIGRLLPQSGHSRMHRNWSCELVTYYEVVITKW